MSDLPIIHPDDDPLLKRRAQAGGQDERGVTFAKKELPPERLKALREFLKHASADEIASIRRMYGDNPEVMKSIGLEVLGETAPVRQEQGSGLQEPD